MSTETSSAGPLDPTNMPSAVSTHVGFFDRFAASASRTVSRAPFFAFCVVLVVVWAPSILVFRDIDTWQLIINTMTTIVTFLLVALLQNTSYRSDEALHHKLNAMAQALADLVEHVAGDRDELHEDVAQLRKAIGLEDEESSS